MKLIRDGKNFKISHTCTDGEANLFPRAVIINLQTGQNVSPAPGYIPLNFNVWGGTYINSSNFVLPLGEYLVIVEVFDDSNFSTPSKKYGTVEEDYWVTDFDTAILAKIKPNPLLDNDTRITDIITKLDNQPTEVKLTQVGDNIINQLTEIIDQSDGGTA